MKIRAGCEPRATHQRKENQIFLSFIEPVKRKKVFKLPNFNFKKDYLNFRPSLLDWILQGRRPVRQNSGLRKPEVLRQIKVLRDLALSYRAFLRRNQPSE